MVADLETLADELRALGLVAGLDAVGIASAEPFDDAREVLEQRKRDGLHGGMAFTYRRPERSTDAGAALAGARALVVGARSYNLDTPAAKNTTAPTGRVAKYGWVDHYEALRAALDEIAAALRHHGWSAKVLADDNALVDRAAAHRAGLGWYGKNTNLLLPQAGSEFVLGSVVTDAPLKPDTEEPMADGCGPCLKCLNACPTGALVAPGVLDARRCLAWLVQQAGVFPRQYREALGDRIYGCDDCQDACPPNQVALRRRRYHHGTEHEPQPTVQLLDIIEERDDAELLRTHGRWYIPERQARYLKRNALVALGNVGDGNDRRTAGALANALADGDALIRAHAVWAAARLGRTDLIDATDRDPMVKAELGDLPPPRRP
ncbi:MAG: epoxyqueuosine reductase [Actinomycetota bacterium]|nr:epoxyqueuosine reductase [Actinomycetota bacterium]